MEERIKKFNCCGGSLGSKKSGKKILLNTTKKWSSSRDVSSLQRQHGCMDISDSMSSQQNATFLRSGSADYLDHSSSLSTTARSRRRNDKTVKTNTNTTNAVWSKKWKSARNVYDTAATNPTTTIARDIDISTLLPTAAAAAPVTPSMNRRRLLSKEDSTSMVTEVIKKFNASNQEILMTPLTTPKVANTSLATRQWVGKIPINDLDMVTPSSVKAKIECFSGGKSRNILNLSGHGKSRNQLNLSGHNNNSRKILNLSGHNSKSRNQLNLSGHNRSDHSCRSTGSNGSNGSTTTSTNKNKKKKVVRKKLKNMKLDSFSGHSHASSCSSGDHQTFDCLVSPKTVTKYISAKASDLASCATAGGATSPSMISSTSPNAASSSIHSKDTEIKQLSKAMKGSVKTKANEYSEQWKNTPTSTNDDCDSSNKTKKKKAIKKNRSIEFMLPTLPEDLDMAGKKFHKKSIILQNNMSFNNRNNAWKNVGATPLSDEVRK